MAFTVCLRTKTNTSNMFVKIIYPGGRVKFYDRPVLASEIMSQNPKCWVTHPDVFQQPWAVVPPDTLLPLGHKFYVVPISTVRKLRRHCSRNSSSLPSSSSPTLTSVDPSPAAGKYEEGRMDKSCLHTLRRPFHCLVRPDDELERGKRREGKGSKSRSKELAERAGKESPIRDMSSERRMGNSSPGTPSHYWQPCLESITEERST